MAQLSDDCFAFGGPLMAVDEAVAIIAARVTAVQETETVALIEADGRILARDVSAPLPLPPFTNSAVDGYAVGSGDLPLDAERAFAVTGRIPAGASAVRSIRPGRGSADLHRRADAGGRRHRVHAGGRAGRGGRQGCAAGRIEARRQCTARGRGHPDRLGRAGGGPAAAAAGRRARGGPWPDQARGAPAHPCRGVLDRK